MGATDGIGGVMGLMYNVYNDQQARQDQRTQWAQEKQMLGLQAQYNKEAAAQSQAYNKEMWDYTNYGNQKKHMEEAGLNPALMYGMGGGGGTSAAGASQEGVGLVSPQGVKMKQGKQQMGIEMASMISQLRLNESAAKKNEADAKKADADAQLTSGAKTKETEMTIENIAQMTKNEKAREKLLHANVGLTYAQKDLAEAEEGQIGASITKMNYEMNKLRYEIANLDVDERLKEATFNSKVEQAADVIKNMATERLQMSADAEAKFESILQKWAEIGQGQERIEVVREGYEKDLEIAGIVQETNKRGQVISGASNMTGNIASILFSALMYRIGMKKLGGTGATITGKTPVNSTTPGRDRFGLNDKYLEYLQNYK